MPALAAPKTHRPPDALSQDMRPTELLAIRERLHGDNVAAMAERIRSNPNFTGVTDELYGKFESGKSVPSKPLQEFLRNL